MEIVNASTRYTFNRSLANATYLYSLYSVPIHQTWTLIGEY
jgi:hypothetical protein